MLIDCEAAQADALARRLTLYRLRRKVVIARDDALAVHWAPDAQDKPLDPRLPALGHRWIAPAEEGDASAAFRAHRLAIGVFEGVGELGQDQTLWLETNAGSCMASIMTRAAMSGRKIPRGCIIAPR